MTIKKIETTEEHQAALARIELLWDAEPNTPEYEELETLSALVDAYEDANFPMV
ncbi:hypothetical protein [Photobacterium leiognathi]|uniref:hypothetical protein n=1 Tax=Photobacterium leiognathi TaxID=553611 RepID=UPI002981CF6F|nr:hypothetical protein [Photobacterium leiognathi]